MEPRVGTMLECAQAPAEGRGGRLRNWALAVSLAAPVSLLVSVAMYLVIQQAGRFEVVRPLQVALAWASVYIGAVALVLSVIAVARNPRGGREIASLAASLVHAAMVLAAVKYL